MKNQNIKCENCYYFYNILREDSFGECRFNPPINSGMFPITIKKSWCGKYLEDDKEQLDK